MGFFEVNTGLLIDGLDANVNTSIVQAENAEEAKKKVCESLTKYFDELEFNHEENDSLFEVDTDYVIVSEIEPKNGIIYSDATPTDAKKPFIFVNKSY